MNARFSSLLCCLLFAGSALAFVPLSAQAQGDFDMVPLIGEAGQGCLGATSETIDVLYNAVCAVLDGAVGNVADVEAGETDADDDGRPDFAKVTLPVGLVAPYECENDPYQDPGSCQPAGAPFSSVPACSFSWNWCLCPPGTTPIGDGAVDPSTGAIWGDYLCIGASSVYVQMDFFFSEDTPQTEPGNALPLGDFNFRVDPFLYNPADGSRLDNFFGDGEIRLTNTHASNTGAQYAIALVVIDRDGDGDIIRTACMMCVSPASTRIAFGADARTVIDFGASAADTGADYNDEGVIDFDLLPGDLSIGSVAEPRTTLLIDLPFLLEFEVPPTFSDGNGLLIDIIHFKGLGNTDIDDDGLSFDVELGCQSNPTNQASTCDDIDGDGLPNAVEDDYADGAAPGKTDSYNPDTDGDGLGDATDPNPLIPDADSDEDGIFDVDDNCPSVANAGQDDQDLDDIGDACDGDKDGDGTANGSDGCNGNMQTNPAENGDNDCDGLGNVADLDDDNDGISDTDELSGVMNPYCTPTVDASTRVDASSTDDCTAGAPTNKNSADTDGDGLSDKAEMVTGFDVYCEPGNVDCRRHIETDPNSKDTDRDGLDDKAEVQATYDWKRSTFCLADPLTTIPGSVAIPGPAPTEIPVPGIGGMPIDNPLQQDGRINGIRVCHPGATDPTDADTDGDGLSDGQEISPTMPSGLPAPAPATVPDPSRLQTDPTDPDDPLQDLGSFGPNTDPCGDEDEPGPLFGSPACGGPLPPIGLDELPFGDSQDVRDLDRDGDTTEPSGQLDILERSFFYYDQDATHTGGDNTHATPFDGVGGVTLFVLQMPGGTSLSTKQPIFTVRFGDAASTPNVQEILVIEDKRPSNGIVGPYKVTYCLVQGDANSVFLYAGSQEFNELGADHPCGHGESIWNTDFRIPGAGSFAGLNSVLKQVDPWFTSLFTNSPNAQWLKFIDEDGDNVPEALVFTQPANPPCGPTGVTAGPVVIVRCTPGTQTVIDLQAADDALKAITDALGGAGVNPPPPPADTDGDGVPDSNDRCAGADDTDPEACPAAADTDGDGVPDDQDRCDGADDFDPGACPVADEPNLCDDPTTGPVETGEFPACLVGGPLQGAFELLCSIPELGPIVVEALGGSCGDPAPDADGDGVPDADDECPGTAEGADVDENGCEVVAPADEDGDGVPDAADDCPGTPEGTDVDDNGCPVAEPPETGSPEDCVAYVLEEDPEVYLAAWQACYSFLTGGPAPPGCDDPVFFPPDAVNCLPPPPPVGDVNDLCEIVNDGEPGEFPGCIAPPNLDDLCAVSGEPAGTFPGCFGLPNGLPEGCDPFGEGFPQTECGLPGPGFDDLCALGEEPEGTFPDCMGTPSLDALCAVSDQPTGTFPDCFGLPGGVPDADGDGVPDDADRCAGDDLDPDNCPPPPPPPGPVPECSDVGNPLQPVICHLDGTGLVVRVGPVVIIIPTG